MSIIFSITVVIIILYWIFTPSSSFISNYDSSRVLFLCGTHGDESAPCDVLLRNSSRSHSSRLHSFIIVNPSACMINRRNYYFQTDINRSYPDSAILPFIHRNKLIVDFHEAWGFEPPSLGRSIYVNPTAINMYGIELFQDLAEELEYNLLYTLPDEQGTLDNYCNNHNLPYVLIEIPGQHDIVPRESRIRTSNHIINYFTNTIG